MYHTILHSRGGINMIVTDNPKGLNEVSFEQRERDLRAEERAEQEELKRKRKSPFSNFYQVNADHSEDLMWLINKYPNAFKVLLFLIDHMDKYNAVMCSYQVLEEYFGVTRQTLSSAVKVLKEHGFIHVYKSGTSNVYVTNPDIAWKSWGNNREYCEFPANIILSASEQEERTKVRDKRIQTVQVRE